MKLLVETRCSRDKRCYPVRLILLRLIGPFKPSTPKVRFHGVGAPDCLSKNCWRTEEDHQCYRDPNATLASPSLVHSFPKTESSLQSGRSKAYFRFMKSSGWASISEHRLEKCENMVKESSI